MQLGEIIRRLEALDDTLCIIAKRPWVSTSAAMLVHLDPNLAIPSSFIEAGYEYFLEVSVAKDEVLAGIADKLTPAQRVAAVIYYAENDAFPDWLCALR